MGMGYVLPLRWDAGWQGGVEVLHDTVTHDHHGSAGLGRDLPGALGGTPQCGPGTP